MPDYLLELRSEEIPALMQRAGAAALHRGLMSAFAEAGVEPAESEVHVTPPSSRMDRARNAFRNQRYP